MFLTAVPKIIITLQTC